MQKAAEHPVRTFTISAGGEYDEARYAGAIARHLGTDHTEIDLPESDALSLASQVPAMYDEPFADPSALPTALICAAARQHVKVCITGDGGDELLAGYNRYLAAGRALDRVARLPRPLRRTLARTLRTVPPRQWDALAKTTRRGHRVPDLGTNLHKLAGVLVADDIHARYRVLTTNVELSQVLDPTEPMTAATDEDAWPTGVDPLNLMLFLDGAITLPDDMLVKLDRASMAVSLECRVPLLDHRFVALAWHLPDEAKIRARRGKWLLRQMLLRHVPKQLFDRPKLGFDPPLASWLRGPLRPWMGDLLSPARLRSQGIFDPRGVDHLVGEHLSGVRNHDYALWTLVVFQAWLDAHDLDPSP